MQVSVSSHANRPHNVAKLFNVKKIVFLYCISLGPQPVGVQCPLTSSLGEFLSYKDWLWYPGLPPVLVSIVFSPFAFHISVFSIHSSPAIGFNSCFFFTTDVSAPAPSTLRLLTVNFQAWDWLWYPMLWSKRRSMGWGVYEAEISFQISAVAGV